MRINMKLFKSYLYLVILCTTFFVPSCVKPITPTKAIKVKASTNYYTEELTTKTARDIFKPVTKTSYSGKDENDTDITKTSVKERIDWSKDDVIFVNMVFDNKIVSSTEYTINSYQTSDGADKSISESVELFTEEQLHSPKKGKHTFFATYPSPSVNNDISFIDEYGNFRFELPENNLGYTIKKQGNHKYVVCDNMDYAYMTACTQTDDAPTEVKLRFQPYFNAYQFIIGYAPDNYSLTNIKLTAKNSFLRTKPNTVLLGGINTNGTNKPVNNVSSSNSTNVINYSFITGEYGEGIPIAKDNGIVDITLIALPLAQSGIEVEFTLTNNTTSNTTTQIIKLPEEATLQPYQKLRVINIGSEVTYEFGDLNDVVINHNGGTGYLSSNFKSTKRVNNNPPQQIGYTLQYSLDNGNTWTNSTPNYLTLSQNQNNHIVTLSPTQPSTSTTAEDELKQEWRKKENFNLAKYNTATGEITQYENSANCYVINGYGTYYIPLVYGNSLQNGSYVTPAPFVDYNNNTITSAIIEPNKTKTAEVLWTTSPNIITNLQIGNPEQNYLFFEVKKENIKKGNAVIAIKVNNKIVWSYHIWITDDDLTLQPVTLGKSFMPVNLGWLSYESNTTSRYLSRTCLVRAVQNESNYISQARVLQTGYFETTISDGESLYYQWGRKDPMKEGHTYSASRVSVGQAIQNPMTFYSPSSNDWFITTGFTNNLWSYNGNKTIYDPSPVGYKVPERFTGFAKTNFDEYNSPKGVRHKVETNLFFPAAGKIGFGGNGTQVIVANKNKGGIYYSATHANNGNAFVIISFQWTEIPRTFVMYVSGSGDDYSHIKDGNTVRPIATF